MKTLIKNGRIVTVVEDCKADVLLKDERISIKRKSYKKILLLTLILVCSFNLFSQTKNVKKTKEKKATTNQVSKTVEPKVVSLPSLTDEEYKVFLAILGNDRSDFVVEDKIEGYETNENGLENIKQFFEELTPDTVEDFVLRNKESAQIERKFPTRNNYTLITKAEIRKFFDKRLDWQGFYKKYPKSGGLYSFSRVGFSKDGKQAIVNVGHSCGGLCGEGNYYLLIKENNKWKIVRKQMTWIS